MSPLIEFLPGILIWTPPQREQGKQIVRSKTGQGTVLSFRGKNDFPHPVSDPLFDYYPGKVSEIVQERIEILDGLRSNPFSFLVTVK